MTQMTTLTVVYASVGAGPLLVDCLIIAGPPFRSPPFSFRLGNERYGIVTASCDHEPGSRAGYPGGTHGAVAVPARTGYISAPQ